ncbi:MarR family winged helix-turn-helix transcriptional regulator [Novosphingobium sp. KACC 22771]|uniref:MarR family winged helix-turn-helix transcriptional regulator n=1 Tax=Novosphingobium sp. KACC 22771 TaxID=3025670 RepID=UPI0023673A6B|nr:MarR family transcriptional regulator [Novosphingobium sp. KACC 22771]WDF73229.1 MarR family transcriptional regulator [Novosphingobium sp. KACC 22771]
MHHESLANAPCACTSLRKATRTLDRLYDAALAPHGITTTQFALMRNIERAGAIVLNQLATLLVMDRTSLYRTIRAIEEAGWVSITDGSGKARLAQITDAGRTMLRAAEPDWEELQAQIHDRLGGEGWARLMEMSGTIISLGQNAGREARA